MSIGHARENVFLTAAVGRLFVANALPMTLVMLMNGLLSVVDAAFLGHFVGTDALAAVSLVFPAVMILIALSALVSGGMSSLLARRLGAGEQHMAAAVFARAHGLALFIAFGLIVAFLAGGGVAVDRLVGAQGDIAAMSYIFLLVTVCATPVQFLLGLHADACRNEGRAGMVALMSVGVTLANIALNYVLIVRFGLGVAGSAWGTALAQGCGLMLLVGLRLRGAGMMPLASLAAHRWTGGWRPIMALGAPLSLSFVGIALVAATVIATLRFTAPAGYSDTVAAYGVVTRIFGFTFLPLMAVALAAQSIVGNNVGAGLYRRSDAALRLAVGISFLYCVAVELVLLGGSRAIGAAFVQDEAVITEVGAILRPMASFYFLTGPVLMLALYFQAVGQPARASALTLIKPFMFSPALIVSFGAFGGGAAIWLAFPLADCLLAAFAAAILVPLARSRASGGGFGLKTEEKTP